MWLLSLESHSHCIQGQFWYLHRIGILPVWPEYGQNMVTIVCPVICFWKLKKNHLCSLKWWMHCRCLTWVSDWAFCTPSANPGPISWLRKLVGCNWWLQNLEKWMARCNNWLKHHLIFPHTRVWRLQTASSCEGLDAPYFLGCHAYEPLLGHLSMILSHKPMRSCHA